MKALYILTMILLAVAGSAVAQQATPIPNNSFETWIDYGNYSDPESWDTPNQETAIPFFGVTTVTRSSDYYEGSYSVRLETMHMTLPPIDVPGFITLGTLTVDVYAGTYVLEGGVPVYDVPTHLKGYYKYSPKGGDSCVIGIGLTRFANGTRDSIGVGYFSTKDTINDWTPFSAWIDYDTVAQPDSMNIIAMSTAQEVMTPGTVLYVDNLYLDYTVGSDPRDPATGIDIYNDRGTDRFLLFFDFPSTERVTATLFDMTGRPVAGPLTGNIGKGRMVLPYQGMNQGIYIIDIVHDSMRYTRKYFINP